MFDEGPAPEILVTDVRLGPYNGLHLVAVARVEFPRTSAIVIGGVDHVLEIEATGLGARYLSGNVTQQELEGAIADVLAVERPRRRWPRKRLPVDVPAVVGGWPARLLDVSYGGVGLEVFGAPMPSDSVEIVIPGLDVDLRGQRVWSHRTDPLQPVSCGVSFAVSDQRWQTFVDTVAAA